MTQSDFRMFPCSPSQPSSDVMLLQQPEGLLMLRRAASQTTSSGGVNFGTGMVLYQHLFLRQDSLQKGWLPTSLCHFGGDNKKSWQKKTRKKKKHKNSPSYPTPTPQKKQALQPNFTQVSFQYGRIGSPTKVSPEAAPLAALTSSAGSKIMASSSMTCGTETVGELKLVGLWWNRVNKDFL